MTAADEADTEASNIVWEKKERAFFTELGALITLIGLCLIGAAISIYFELDGIKLGSDWSHSIAMICALVFVGLEIAAHGIYTFIKKEKPFWMH